MELAKQQEILRDIADIAIEVYAMESSPGSSAKKALDKEGEEKAKLKADLTRAYVYEAFPRIEQRARHILSAMEEGDVLRIQLSRPEEIDPLHPDQRSRRSVPSPSRSSKRTAMWSETIHPPAPGAGGFLFALSCRRSLPFPHVSGSGKDALPGVCRAGNRLYGRTGLLRVSFLPGLFAKRTVIHPRVSPMMNKA